MPGRRRAGRTAPPGQGAAGLAGARPRGRLPWRRRAGGRHVRAVVLRYPRGGLAGWHHAAPRQGISAAAGCHARHRARRGPGAARCRAAQQAARLADPAGRRWPRRLARMPARGRAAAATQAAAITAAVLPWVLVLIAFALLLAMLRHARLGARSAGDCVGPPNRSGRKGNPPRARSRWRSTSGPPCHRTVAPPVRPAVATAWPALLSGVTVRRRPCRRPPGRRHVPSPS